ncbi:MAG: 8-oxo-dGTP diphosphatase [Candidatus Saccharibacteria bacterium]|nr:8-oxo-dGTP diphosphatase [Candidatus Saccharibacteria bacterium]
MSSKHTGVGVGVLVFKQGQLLLCQRTGSHGANSWAPPGGHIEFGEEFTEAAAREAREETGLEITNMRLVGVTNDFFEPEKKHYITVWIASDWLGGEPRIMEPDKCLSMHWETFDNLPTELFTSFKNFTESEFFGVVRTLTK